MKSDISVDLFYYKQLPSGSKCEKNTTTTTTGGANYYYHHHHHHHHLFLFRSTPSIGLRECLAIRGSCFSFLDPLDIW
jgi:hypothetical protein